MAQTGYPYAFDGKVKITALVWLQLFQPNSLHDSIPYQFPYYTWVNKLLHYEKIKTQFNVSLHFQ